MVFRILQEALNNVIRHAKASNVTIWLRKKEKKIELVIQDDGIGFNTETSKKGAGLKNIQNRVYLANGNLLIDTAPGKGSKIIINFPFNKKQ
jgi:signal transduction histidine kinase